MTLKIENYNIHDIIKFQLINNNLPDLLNHKNPEYEYFTVYNDIKPDFSITVTKAFDEDKKKDGLKYYFRKRYPKWEVEILEYENEFLDLTIVPFLSGSRSLYQFSTLKNIYVRSLLYYYLIKMQGILVHSSAVKIKDKAYIFAGRPGVYKTSIIMDLLRKPDTYFLGEENIIIKEGLIYPFPLNIRSLSYKIKHFKDENPPSKIHKIALGLSLLNKKVNQIFIPKPCYPEKLFYLVKEETFKIIECQLENIIYKLVQNEIMEIDITPTHTFSGISNNYYFDYLNEIGMCEDIEKKIKKIFINNFSDITSFNVSMPGNYYTGLIDKLIGDKIWK